MKTPIVLRNKFWEWALVVCAAGACVFVLMVLTNLQDRRPWSTYTFNRAVALTAVMLVLAAIVMGTLFRTTSFRRRPVRFRRPLGIFSVILMVVHVCLSFFVLSERYNWAYYAQNWESLLYGFLALIGFLLLWLTSYAFAHRRMGSVAWKRIQNGVYVLLALACLHMCHCGKPLVWLAWMQGLQEEGVYRGGLFPPLSLLLFLGLILVVVIRLLEPLLRGRERERGGIGRVIGKAG